MTRSDLPLRRPEPFPQNSLLAARVALALDGEERVEFSRRVYAAEFGEGLPIADRATIATLMAKLGLDPEGVFARAENEANKALLKAESARAAELGIIGAPCLVTEDGEVFWGNDRLEQGLDWAAEQTRLNCERSPPRARGIGMVRASAYGLQESSPAHRSYGEADRNGIHDD